MNDTLKKLQEIADGLEDINRQMNEEAKIQAKELADRKRLGLEGDAAIVHYNQWMDKHGLSHLKVNLPS